MLYPKHSKFPLSKDIAEKLRKTNKALTHLCKRKGDLHQRIQRNLKNIQNVKVKIDKIESEIEQVAEQKMLGDMKGKLGEEIAQLKTEKQQTVKHLRRSKYRLKQKLKEYKALSKQLM